MGDRYSWTDSGIMELRTATQAAHTALGEASILVNTLVAEMDADAGWGAEHKKAFMVWMDLLRQYHAKMADPSIGEAMVAALDSFLARLDTYQSDSSVQTSLGQIP